MKNISRLLLTVSALALLSGCAGILNPYESGFACPNNDKGKCISIKGAYNEDLATSKPGLDSADTLPATVVEQGGSIQTTVVTGKPGAAVPAIPAGTTGSPVVVTGGGVAPGTTGVLVIQQPDKPAPCCGNKPDPNAVEVEPVQVVVLPPPQDIPLQEYRTAALTKVTKLLREPVTPVIAPPQVMRVLILPYEDDDGALNLQRFKYIMVDRPKWVMGDYLAREEGGQ